MTKTPSFFADLHLHTYWSYDGEATVEQVFAAARSHKFSVIAITEHHCIDSIPAATQVARTCEDIRYIRSAEMSVTTSIGSVDLLCYGFPEIIPAALQTVFDEYHAWQRARAQATVSGMQKLGHEYSTADLEDLLRTYRPSQILARQGTTHVNNQLQCDYFIKRGFIQNETEYASLMSMIRKSNPMPYPEVRHVVDAIKNAGVQIAIAHPIHYFNVDDERRMDLLREECRLDGIECIHSWIKPELTSVYRAYCLKHKLFSTGGSDSHTTEHHQRLMGKYGTPKEWWDELDQRLPK
jgi:3',5'-nucleoside bisphosphate phosphatase